MGLGCSGVGVGVMMLLWLSSWGWGGLMGSEPVLVLGSDLVVVVSA